jgi:hypothetical protein
LLQNGTIIEIMASRITRSAARASSRRADRRAQAAEGGGTATEISGLGAELRWLGYGLFSIWIFLSLLSWSPEDAGWFQQGSRQMPTNWLGRFGAWTADSLLFGFGFSAGWFVVLSAALAYASWRLARQLREVQRLVLPAALRSAAYLYPWEQFGGLALRCFWLAAALSRRSVSAGAQAQFHLCQAVCWAAWWAVLVIGPSAQLA